MINITIYKTSDSYSGFKCLGHAEYDDPGKDIVCAAISALVINTVNSIEQFTEDEFTEDTDEESGLIEIRFRSKPCHDSKLLIDSLCLGLESVSDGANDFIKIIYKEE